MARPLTTQGLPPYVPSTWDRPRSDAEHRTAIEFAIDTLNARIHEAAAAGLGVMLEVGNYPVHDEVTLLKIWRWRP